jgi:hypothetical protein
MAQTTQTMNKKGTLLVHKFSVPQDQFRDLKFLMIEAIENCQPDPTAYLYAHPPLENIRYYHRYPEKYLEFKERVCNYIRSRLSCNNMFFPLIDIFDYADWAGRFYDINCVNGLNFDTALCKLIGFNESIREFGTSYLLKVMCIEKNEVHPIGNVLF